MLKEKSLAGFLETCQPILGPMPNFGPLGSFPPPPAPFRPLKRLNGVNSSFLNIRGVGAVWKPSVSLLRLGLIPGARHYGQEMGPQMALGGGAARPDGGQRLRLRGCNRGPQRPLDQLGRGRQPYSKRQRPPPSALPRAGPAPKALTQQREGGVLSLRGPRFSGPQPPPSGFPFSGTPGIRARLGHLGRWPWCNPSAQLKTPEN